MKGSTAEGLRKRRLQKTNLLKMRRSNKSNLHQQNMKKVFMSARKVKQQTSKMYKTAGVLARDQLMISPRVNQASFVKNKHLQHYQTEDSLRSKQNEVINKYSLALYGGTSSCACLDCRRKYLEISQQQQWSREQIKVTNTDFNYRKQHMVKFQKASTVKSSTKQNKHNSYYDSIPNRKQAHFPITAQNFHLPSSLTTVAVKAPAEYDINLYQQCVKFQPQKVSVQLKDKNATNQFIFNKQLNPLSEKNTYFRNQYLPGYHNHHYFNPISTFQGSRGSLTSPDESVSSETRDVVMSQHLQMINTAEFYNFVNY